MKPDEAGGLAFLEMAPDSIPDVGPEFFPGLLDVGQPEAVESSLQLRGRPGLLSQKKIDVREVLGIGTPHHLGQDEERIIHGA
jgi:hypothetical protein